MRDKAVADLFPETLPLRFMLVDWCWQRDQHGNHHRYQGDEHYHAWINDRIVCELGFCYGDVEIWSILGIKTEQVMAFEFRRFWST